MRPVVVIEAFPHLELLLQIDVALVGEEWVELILVASVRPLDLPIQLLRSGFDVDVFPTEVRGRADSVQKPWRVCRSITVRTRSVRPSTIWSVTKS